MPTLQVSANVTVKSRPFFGAFIGSCNRCGLCCNDGYVEWQMTQADPDNPKGQLHKGKCLYLVGQAGQGKTTSCQIRTGDVDINTIPLRHKNWYLQECVDFPNKDDPTEWSTDGRVINIAVCAYRKITVIVPGGQ